MHREVENRNDNIERGNDDNHFRIAAPVKAVFNIEHPVREDIRENVNVCDEDGNPVEDPPLCAEPVY